MKTRAEILKFFKGNPVSLRETCNFLEIASNYAEISNSSNGVIPDKLLLDFIDSNDNDKIVKGYIICSNRDLTCPLGISWSSPKFIITNLQVFVIDLQAVYNVRL